MHNYKAKIITLSQGIIGKNYKLYKLETNSMLTKRLFSVGLCVTDIITIEYRSFFGSTIAFSIHNIPKKIKLCLRKTEADLILIQEI